MTTEEFIQKDSKCLTKQKISYNKNAAVSAAFFYV